MLEVRLLGQLDVRRDGTQVSIPSRAAQSLLAYLLLTAGTLHRREKLAGLLWPDSKEENARQNLRHELWRLRQAIESKTPRPGEAPALLVDDIAIGFNAQSDYWLDVAHVEKRTGERVAADDLIASLALYRGELLPGFYDEWVVLERERVRAVFEQRMARLLELLVEEKRWKATLEWSERWIALGQTPEPAYCALMVAHSATGNMSQVAAVYQRCVQAMRHDLGVEPSAQTRALFERLSQGEKIPESSRSAIARPPPKSRPENDHEGISVPASASPLRSRDRPMVSPVLVGRSEALASLDRLIAEARGGHGKLALIEGEAGIGKSRLVAEARTRVTALGWRILQGNCFEQDTALPYAPLLDLLRTFCATRSSEELARDLGPAAPELTKLLPELAARFPNLTPKPALEPEQEKHRLFEWLGQFFVRLAGFQPGLVVVEDLHWSDGASLEFLIHLARRVPAQPILLLLTCRSDEPNANLAHFVAQLDRERLVTELALEPLSADEVDAMLRAIFNMEQSAPLESLEGFLALTEGNPFFIEEILKALVMAREVYYADGIWHRKPTSQLHVPRSVHDAVRRRVEQLSERARRALTMAAVAGRRFDFALLQESLGTSEQDLLAVIKELVAAQLVVEDSSDQFSFRHPLTREAVYATLLARERLTLHRTIGETLERMDADSIDTHAADLADHFHTAGVWDKALRYSQRAGEEARAIHALPEALTHLTRALEACRRLSCAPSLALLRGRGEVHEMLGHFEQARTDLEAGLATARATGDRHGEWQALLDLSLLWENREYRESGAYLERALDLARQMDDPGCVARSLNRLSHWHFNRERNVEALAGLQQALVLFRSLNDRRGAAETLNLLAEVSYVRGDLIQSAAYYDEAIAHLRELDDRRGLAHALAMLPLRLRMDTEVPGPFDVAELLRANETAQRIARDMGWRAGEITALGIFAEVLTSTGDYARALAAAKATLALAQDINHQVHLARGHWVLGDAYLGIYALPEAESHLSQALEIARATGSANFEHHATLSLASVYQLRNDLPRAQELLQKDIQPWHAEQSQHERDNWASWAELKLEQADAASALQIVEQLISSARNIERYGPRSIPRLSHLRGRALAALGRLNEAQEELYAALEVARVQGRQPLLWQIQASCGKLLKAQSKPDKAAREFAAARSLVQELASHVPDASQRQSFVAFAQARLQAGQRSPYSNRSASGRKRIGSQE